LEVFGKERLRAFSQELSTKAPMWWGFSAMSDWMVLIEFAKNTGERKRLSGHEHCCSVGQKPWGVRISISLGESKENTCVVVFVIMRSKPPSQWRCIYTCLGC